MALSEDLRDELAGYLDQGWSVVGYNTQLLAMGNVTHFILIQNQYALKSVTFVMDRGMIMGSTITDLAPAGAA
jgi:hypothetical protein